MIVLENVFKYYPIRGGKRRILNDICLSIQPGQRLGILGGNGAGKSTLIRIIGGAETPTSGVIRRRMSVSWPLAFSGGFQNSLTGEDNIRFICRVYGVNFAEKMRFIDDFSELGKYLREPIRTYSAGMRAKLAFSLSLSIDFSCLLIDEVIAVGDAKFQEKCKAAIFDGSDRSVVFVSHYAYLISEYCDSAAILVEGKLSEVRPAAEALAEYMHHS